MTDTKRSVPLEVPFCNLYTAMLPVVGPTAEEVFLKPCTTGRIYDHAEVTDPCDLPDVTVTLLFLPTPAGTTHTRLLSLTHVLDSHAVFPTRACALYPDVPSPAPASVTCVPPVVGPS